MTAVTADDREDYGSSPGSASFLLRQARPTRRFHHPLRSLTLARMIDHSRHVLGRGQTRITATTMPAMPTKPQCLGPEIAPNEYRRGNRDKA